MHFLDYACLGLGVQNNKNAKKVIQIDKEGNETLYEGLHDVIVKNPLFLKSNICKALAGQRKTANGFSWKYQD